MWRKSSSKRRFEFEPINVDGIVADLDIRNKALRAARDNKPQTESENLDPIELAIIERVERHHGSEEKRCLDYLHSVEEDRNQAQGKLESSNFNVLSAGEQQRIVSLIHASDDSINNARDRVDETKKNLDIFKDKH